MTAPAADPTVLVINSGSSSLKYQLLDAATGESLATGLIDRIGEPVSGVTHTVGGAKTKREASVPDHEAAIALMLELFAELGPAALPDAGIVGVGHRVVHGGTSITGPTIVDDDAETAVAELIPLAPLHNPANLAGIREARKFLPDVPHVIVADTAFFTDLPADAATYALNKDVAEKYQVRRYGAHGTSHQYVSRAAAAFLGKSVEDTNVIVLHLGNGASASAVRGGHPIDTSMGLTPLEGLVMGTRTGDIDPAVVFHLYRNAGMSIDEIDDLVNRQSGVKGLSGVQDMRELADLVAAEDADALLAFGVYLLRLKKYVGAYYAELGRLDAIVFTAGIGENDDAVRAGCLAGLEMWGIEVDPERNAGRFSVPTEISPPGAKIKVLVIPTNEELEITNQVLEVI